MSILIVAFTALGDEKDLKNDVENVDEASQTHIDVSQASSTDLQTGTPNAANPTSIPLDQILALPSLTDQAKVLSKAVTNLPEDRAFNLLKQIKTIRYTDQRNALLKAIFANLSKLNLDRTLTSFSELPPPDQSLVVDSIYRNISVNDAADAVRASNGFAIELQEQALFEFLTASPDIDGERLIELAKIAPRLLVPIVVGLDGYTEQHSVLRDLVSYWSQKDIPLTLKLIKELHVATLDDRLLRKSAIVLAVADPEEALRFSHEYHGRFGYVLESVVLQAITVHDPERALALLPSVRREFYSFTSYGDELSMVPSLFALNPEYAVEFGRSLPADAMEAYFWELSDEFCDVNPQIFIDLKDRITAIEALSWTSRCLLDKARDEQKLTEQQFESLYEVLQGDELMEINGYDRSDFVAE